MIRNKKQLSAGKILSMYGPIFARHSNIKKGAVFHLNSLGIIDLENECDEKYIRKCCDILYAYREMQLLSASPEKIKNCLEKPEVINDLRLWLDEISRLNTREGYLKNKVMVYLYGEHEDYNLCESIQYAVAI